MLALERQAREAWAVWGPYAKATVCAACGSMENCHAARVRGPFVCVACFDQEEHVRLLFGRKPGRSEHECC